MLPVPNVLSYEAFGKLILEWTQNPASRPATLDEFKQKVAGIVGLPLPEWIKNVGFVDSDTTLLIRLPPKELLKQALAELAATTESYKLPRFYGERLLDGAPPDTPEGNIRLFHMRLGDYSISMCG